MSDDQARIDDLRKLVNIAKGALYDAVEATCPGPHEPRQHRDRRPPWCAACGRDSAGHLWKPPTTQAHDAGKEQDDA